MTMKKDAESVRQYRRSIRDADGPKGNEGICIWFFDFLISRTSIMRMIPPWKRNIKKEGTPDGFLLVQRNTINKILVF